ncbi:chloride channel CLIC-like protein 1 isoform X2 [Genypterus blacodes]|uniref:chloride channel CLIC-like protein 1 isoform X2 n=1 Tax=Genypterus blacodes TaxID=154954 RepID=UPI003F75B8AE
MYPVVLFFCLSLVVSGQRDDDWIDPYDMLNYDPSTKTMRKPSAEPAVSPQGPTKRREHSREPEQLQPACDTQVAALQKQIEQQMKKITVMEQQPSCNPVFKRLLSRLLKELEKLGLAVAEIQAFLKGGDSYRTGALDNAISHLLVELKPHNYEAWKWRFEDAFGVELDTIIKASMFVLILVVIISTQLWSTVSWFVQFRRFFAICFIISIIWNWLYLYKIAFAEHQNNMVKMDSFNEKCTGMKKIDWMDGLKDWFRRTWTLQDDPCESYYHVLLVNPILLVPPTKAIAVTITTFITEPLKHFGQGISEFLRALLKDLPITLQIPVLLTIVLAVVVCMYGSVQAAFQHGITAPFRHRRDPPPPPLVDQPRPLRRIRNHEHNAVEELPQDHARDGSADGQQVLRLRRRRAHRVEYAVENIRNVDRAYGEDATDEEPADRRPEAEDLESRSATGSDSQGETDSDDQQENQEEAAAGGDAAAATPQPKPLHSSQAKPKPLKENKNLPQQKPSRDGAVSRAARGPRAQGQMEIPARNRPPQTEPAGEVQVQEALVDDRPSSVSLDNIETLGVSVQETAHASLAQ